MTVEAEAFSSSGSASCGPDVVNGACSTRIYPKEVIKSVREQVKSFTLDPNVPVQVPHRMELDEHMKAANWKDAAMVELRIHEKDNHHLVEEIDILRSREMIQKHSGKYGSLCLVVRRPG